MRLLHGWREDDFGYNFINVDGGLRNITVNEKENVLRQGIENTKSRPNRTLSSYSLSSSPYNPLAYPSIFSYTGAIIQTLATCDASASPAIHCTIVGACGVLDCMNNATSIVRPDDEEYEDHMEPLQRPRSLQAISNILMHSKLPLLAHRMVWTWIYQPHA